MSSRVESFSFVRSFVFFFLSFFRFFLSFSPTSTPPFSHALFSFSNNSYVEQLGTFMPIEAPQAGELVAFLVDEGNPVEYRQPVAEIAPFFGGHIIGDSKHA